jgi:hypothetical protein
MQPKSGVNDTRCHMCHKNAVIAAFTAGRVVRVAPRCPVGPIPGGHGRASVSEDALRRNAAVAAELSSIRQS